MAKNTWQSIASDSWKSLYDANYRTWKSLSYTPIGATAAITITGTTTASRISTASSSVAITTSCYPWAIRRTPGASSVAINIVLTPSPERRRFCWSTAPLATANTAQANLKIFPRTTADIYLSLTALGGFRKIAASSSTMNFIAGARMKKVGPWSEASKKVASWNEFQKNETSWVEADKHKLSWRER